MAMFVNLGCGDRRLPGFIHVDTRSLEAVDLLADIAELPLKDNSITLLYTSHVLEHVRKPEIASVLGEWRRVLKPYEGVLRLSVPDFAVLSHLYLNEGVTLIRLWGLICGRQDYEQNIHYTWWDYELLCYTLQQHGFYNMCRWNPPSVHPCGYNDFSHGCVNGEMISLNVEALAS